MPGRQLGLHIGSGTVRGSAGHRGNAMTRRSATLRLRGFAAWTGTLAAIIGLFAPSIGITEARASAPTTNNLGNPGFEQAVEPTLATGCPAVNPSSGGLGNWKPWSTSSSSTAAVRSTAQAHSGTYSGQVTVPAGGPVGGFLQQLTNLAPTDSFTMSEWVYPIASEPSGQEFTLYWGNACNVTGVLGITVLPDRVLGGLGASAITGPPIAFNAWHNLALAVSGTSRTATLSVDAKVAGTAPIGPVPTSSNGAWIFLGNGAGAGTPLPVADNFFYDDVSVAGLVADRASWPFDEGTGTVAHDATGNGHDGALIGGVTWAPTSTATGVKLDGSTGYVEASNPPMVGNSITLSAAVNPSGVFGDSLGGPIIVGQYDTHDTATAYYLSLINGNHVYFSLVGPSCDSLHGADVLSVSTTSAITAGTSTILRATFDTTNQRAHVYINDQDAALTTISSGTVSQICNTTTPVRIGAAEGITGLISTGFAGTIDDVNISASVECSSGGNLVCNPGFESSLGATQATGAANQSVGNWLSYHNRTSGIPPDVVSTPVHSGAAAGQVQTTPGYGGAAFVQDFPTFPASTSYTLSAYVWPVTGRQQIELFFGWDRGVVGTAAGVSKIDIQPSQIAFQAWGQSATAPVALTAGSWHHVELFVDASSLTSTLSVDGTGQGSTSAGTGLAQSDATLWAGQEGGNGGSVPDHYYYDDFSLTLATRTPGPPQAITLTPQSATSPIGSPVTLTAHVTDAAGNPVAGLSVGFELKSGPDDADGGVSATNATTDTSGNASTTLKGYTSGTDVLDAFFDLSDGQAITSPLAKIVFVAQPGDLHAVALSFSTREGVQIGTSRRLARFSDPDGSNLSARSFAARIDWGDSNFFSTAASVLQSGATYHVVAAVPHIFCTAGTYTFKVTVLEPGDHESIVVSGSLTVAFRERTDERCDVGTFFAAPSTHACTATLVSWWNAQRNAPGATPIIVLAAHCWDDWFNSDGTPKAQTYTFVPARKAPVTTKEAPLGVWTGTIAFTGTPYGQSRDRFYDYAYVAMNLGCSVSGVSGQCPKTPLATAVGGGIPIRWWPAPQGTPTPNQLPWTIDAPLGSPSSCSSPPLSVTSYNLSSAAGPSWVMVDCPMSDGSGSWPISGAPWIDRNDALISVISAEGQQCKPLCSPSGIWGTYLGPKAQADFQTFVSQFP
jgi:hypothetical protein